MARITQQASVLPSVPISGGGTQSNEFNAAIKSVTSSTTVGAVFLYDTSADSDGGKWRSKCKGLSWFDEPTLPAGTGANQYNSATRSARSEFPAMALIVADNDSGGTSTVSIYDLDDVAAPLWLQFSQGGSYPSAVMLGRNAPDITSVTMLNGRLCVGLDNSGYGEALAVINFPEDTGIMYSTASWGMGQNIANRNTNTTVDAGTSAGDIVNIVVNDVAATVVEGAEIGALGLPIPTVAVATAGGVSVIHANGDVYDIDSDGSTYDEVEKVFFTDDGGVGYAFAASGSATWPFSVGIRKVPFADSDITGWNDAKQLEQFNPVVSGAVSGLTTNTNAQTSSNAGINAVTPTSRDGLAIGYADRLSIIKRNPSNMSEGMVSYATSTYATGYMVGDIRGAWLANTALYDRSVKANTLTQSGALTDLRIDGTDGTGSTNAELKAYGGFSASNFLSQAYDADFDFADGKFSVMCWVKVVAGSGYQSIVNRYDSGDTGKGWFMYLRADEKAYINILGASTVSSGFTGVLSDGWHFLVGVSDGAKVKIYADGVLANSATLAAGDLSNSSAILYVGTDSGSGSNPQLGSLSLLRISATVPTPQQIKEIYAAEKPLFAAGAKCLLDENPVNDLAYDKTSGLLHVASETTDDGKTFRGLEAVGSLTSDGTFGLGANKPMDYLSASGGVVAGVGGETAGSDNTSGVGVNLPALDVRAELLEGESKIPDDGKFHFEGVTTDATQTVIGQIPVAEDECVSINARVTSKVYKFASYASHYEDVAISFQRETGGNVAVSSAFSNPTHSISDNNVATMDVVLVANTSNNTVEIKVTGAAYRIEWKASVEVQRISEKTYER